MTLRIRPANDADVDSIAGLVTAAFHPSTDAITRTLFPLHLNPAGVAYGEAARPWRLVRKSHGLHEERVAMMLVVDDALGGKVVGLGLWEMPAADDEPDNEIPHPEVACDALDKDAVAELRKIVDADAKKHFGQRGTNTLWHLDYLAVDPQQGRRGIGSMLLDWGIEKARQEGKDCYLIATPMGHSLYRRVGFEDLDRLEIFGVPHYSMIKRHAAK